MNADRLCGAFLWCYLLGSALAVIMCQAGSFVPAQEATLPIFDAVFTRVGASDSLAKGVCARVWVCVGVRVR